MVAILLEHSDKIPRIQSTIEPNTMEPSRDINTIQNREESTQIEIWMVYIYFFMVIMIIIIFTIVVTSLLFIIWRQFTWTKISAFSSFGFYIMIC